MPPSSSTRFPGSADPSGVPVAGPTECGTVTLRFPIAATADHEAARARHGSRPTAPPVAAP